MEVVIQVTQTAAEVTQTSPPAAVRDALVPFGLALQPVHPGSTDQRLASYYRVQVPNRSTADGVIAAVAGLSSVTAAYLKPTAEPA